MNLSAYCSEEALDELTAIEAIYGEDAVAADPECGTVSVTLESGPAVMTAGFLLGPSYPSQEAPIVELESAQIDPSCFASWVQELGTLFQPGEPVLYTWLETLRTQLEAWAEANAVAPVQEQEGGGAAPEQEQAEASSPRASGADRPRRAAAAVAPQPVDDARLIQKLQIVHGEPFTEKKSTFQAHLASVSCVEEVEAFMAYLLTKPKIAHATHNMMAYRFQLPNGAVAQDCDDDGEAAAGGRMLHLLQITGACGVCVVVSRWFGGVLLGPARFTHINNAARQLLAAEGRIAAAPAGKGPRSRK